MSHDRPPFVSALDIRLRRLAELSTARACGFAGLANLCLMTGLSYNLSLALKAGGYGTLLVMTALLLAAQGAERKPFRRTELWLMLEERERPPAELAQAVIGRARRDAFLRFARYHALVAALLLAFALIVGLRG